MEKGISPSQKERIKIQALAWLRSPPDRLFRFKQMPASEETTFS